MYLLACMYARLYGWLAGCVCVRVFVCVYGRWAGRHGGVWGAGADGQARVSRGRHVPGGRAGLQGVQDPPRQRTTLHQGGTRIWYVPPPSTFLLALYLPLAENSGGLTWVRQQQPR